MVSNLIALLVFTAITLALGWLAWRAWHARNGFVKWGGGVLASLLTLVVALFTVLGAVGIYKVYGAGAGPVPNLKVAGTAEQIARGQHIARIDCAGCHSLNDDVPLSGGRDIAEAAPLPLGSFFSINLTPGGPLKDWSDGEILRTMREGVDRDGNRLVVMSANTVRFLSDEDKQAVIAYLRSQPAVNNPTPLPPDRPNLLAFVLVGTGMIPLPPPVRDVITVAPRGETAAYGAYVAEWYGCERCHGPNLAGGSGGLSPVGPNLRLVVGWTREQFIKTIRTGVDPSNHQLSDEMPWKIIGKMDDDELGALYAYLKSLPPVK